ncbi:MAG: ankyrin repeat domain-containing protein [Planctomycetaceae bacterium]|nr:ankyrin repeat domain-containing protein [Planctomycetaceae bacterium]
MLRELKFTKPLTFSETKMLTNIKKFVYLNAVVVSLTMVITCYSAEPDTPSIQARKAIETGSLEKVKELFREDPALIYVTVDKTIPNNWQTYKGTLLHVAAQSKNVDIVKFLLEQGADPTVKDSDNYTPICYAVSQLNKEMARYLWANGSNDPTDDCQELPMFLKALGRLAGNDAANDKVILLKQRAAQIGEIARRLNRTIGQFDRNDYLLKVQKKTNDFYKRFEIKDNTTYNKDTKQQEYNGKTAQGMDGLYAGLHNLKVTDEDLANLAQEIPRLTFLNIQGCEEFTDTGLKHIANMKSLQRLWIHGQDKITDDGLEGLKDLTNLKDLHLGFCKNLSGSGLKYLKELKQLETIYLFGNSIAGSELQHLKNLPKLRTVELSYNKKLTDDGLEYLKENKQLESINVSECPLITDAGLEHLNGLTGLKYFTWSKCEKITESGIAQLQEVLPQCKFSPEVKKKENVNSKFNTTKSDATTKTEPQNTTEQTSKPDAVELMMGIAFGEIGDKKNDNKTVSELLNESADAVIKRRQSENNTDKNTTTKKTDDTNPFVVQDKNEVAEKHEKPSSRDASLTSYIKTEAGFTDKEVTVKNLLKYGTAELMQKIEELNGKLRNADAFDKAEIEKRIKSTNDTIGAKLKEIKSKTFCQDYSYSPYDSDVKVNGYTASFPIYITRDFYLIAKSIKLRSPFSDVTGEILDNKYGIAETAVANTSGSFLPKWERILVSGNAESIKKLVREKNKYRVRIWFKNLQGTYNEEVRMTSMNAFAPLKKITTLISFAELISVEIFDIDNPPPTWLTTDSPEVEKISSDNVDVTGKPTEQTDKTTITITNSAPPLNKPDEWLKPLRELQKDDIQPVVNVQRFYSLLELADAAKDKERYRKILKEFFDALKSIDSPTQRMQFIFEVLPGMFQQNNFEGLKDASKRINMMMEKRNYDNYEWKKSCAVLAAFSIIAGDNVSANGFIDTGRLNQGGKTKSESMADSADVFLMNWYVKSIIRQPIDLQEIKNADKKVNNFSKNNIFLLAGLSRHLLAERRNRESYTDFQGILKKMQGYEKCCAYHFGIADAILGDFDGAKIHWKQYDNSGVKIWPQELLAFIVRQEFLSGQFGGFKDMHQDKRNVVNLRNKTTKFRDGEFWDMSNVVSAFYFDYGRGLGRHKTKDELVKEWVTLKAMFNGDSNYGNSDLAFFMAGVATGLRDKNSPNEEERNSNVTEAPVPVPAPASNDAAEKASRFLMELQ